MEVVKKKGPCNELEDANDAQNDPRHRTHLTTTHNLARARFTHTHTRTHTTTQIKPPNNNNTPVNLVTRSHTLTKQSLHPVLTTTHDPPLNYTQTPSTQILEQLNHTKPHGENIVQNKPRET